MIVLIIANNDVGLYKFRKEFLVELISRGNEVIIALPMGEYITQMMDLGCKYIDIPVDRRGMNPITDFKLFLKYRQICNEVSPDVVLTFTIKPNVYGGLFCRIKKIPYFSNVTGLGTSIENPGLIQKFSLILYRMGLKKSDCVFFQNLYNMRFMDEHHVHG